MMRYTKLETLYKRNFELKQHHGWDMSYIDGMVPWERYMYLDMLRSLLEEQEKERLLQEQEEKAKLAEIQRRLKSRR